MHTDNQPGHYIHLVETALLNIFFDIAYAQIDKPTKFLRQTFYNPVDYFENWNMYLQIEMWIEHWDIVKSEATLSNAICFGKVDICLNARWYTDPGKPNLNTTRSDICISVCESNWVLTWKSTIIVHPGICGQCPGDQVGNLTLPETIISCMGLCNVKYIAIKQCKFSFSSMK